ncbi:MAG: phospholipase D-like domain-containing protein [Planctomycetota bacterium]
MKSIFTFFMGLVVGLLLLYFASIPIAEGGEEATKTEVFFAPSGKEQLLHRALNEQLKRSQQTIQVAMFQWTSRKLSETIIALKKKTKIQILLDQDQVQEKWSQADELKQNGIEIRYLELPGDGFDRIKMHHKFLIVDQKIVATGSMNWTIQADEANHEALLILEDRKIAQKFSAEFNKMWEKAKPWN